MAFWIKDGERCPFGLGWEVRRRGDSIDENPFPVGTRRWQEFRDGWNKYQESKSATYHEPTVITTLDEELE